MDCGDKMSKGSIVSNCLVAFPLVNAFTLFYPTIEAIFLSPFGVRVGDEESASQRRCYWSDCALLGMCRWKAGGGRRTEKIDKDYEENVAIDSCDCFQQSVDDEVPHMVLSDGKKVWFSYPGFGRLYGAVGKSGQAMVLFGNGRQVRCFYKSKNEPDKLGYKDESSPTAQVTAFWQCKDGERNVVKDLDVLIKEFQTNKDSIKGRGLYNDLKDCQGRASRSFSSSVVDEGRLAQLKVDLGRMKTRVKDYEQNKCLEKRLSEQMENVEKEIGKSREEPEFRQVVPDQDNCKEVFELYVKSETIDLVAASNVESKVNALMKGCVDARKKLEQRRRADELARIEKRKKEIAKLYAEKKYTEAIAECDKETGCNAGAWAEDAEIWRKLRAQAQAAKDKIERDIEEKRIAEKLELVDKLLAEKRFAAVIELCEEEKGQNPGARPEDMAQWKSIRDKALCSELLSKAEERSKTTYCLKGFYLGMTLAEAEILLDYYFPELSHRRDADTMSKIFINDSEMPFCEANYSGSVKRFNFDRKMLEKWFDYDYQTYQDWALVFGRSYSIDFRAGSVSDGMEVGEEAVIRVSQDMYCYTNRKAKYKLIYFGDLEKDDHMKIINRASKRAIDKRVLQGIAMQSLMLAMWDSSDVEKYVNARLKEYNAWWNKYLSSVGADEGTLRVVQIDD